MLYSIRYTSWLLVLILVLSFTLPPVPAHAAPIQDILGQVFNNATPSGNFFLTLLFGLLAGQGLGKLFPINPPTSENTGNNPSRLHGTKEVIGFYAEWWGTDTSSFNSLSRNVDVIDTIAPFWATLKSDGTVVDRGGNDHASVVKFARQNKVNTLLLINNEKQTAQTPHPPIHSILNNVSLRTKAINNIEAFIKKYQLDGVNIDFEIVPPEDKDVLTQFMKELYLRLHPQGYLVTIDVFPKENEQNDVAIAYDYQQLSKYADKIILMTYDNHGAWSSAGPIADIGWVERNLKYALKFIPKDKVYLGIAAYGYDWYGSKVDSLEYSAIMNISRKFNAPILWDEKSKSPYLSYTDSNGVKHSIWFENSKSLGYKLDLVQKYDIAGAAVWKLGEEDPGYWQVFKSKFSR